MRLQELISEIDYRQIVGNADIDVSGLAYDSRKVRAGDAFFCIKGFKLDGHAFAVKAQAAGAAALVVEQAQPELAVTQVVVDNAREAMAQMASAFFGHPTRRLKLVGITGTNGKTTTSFMVEGILKAAGYTTGLWGTVESHIGDQVYPVSHTTPEAVDLQAFFGSLVEAGVEAAAIEVSSHAIDLQRVEACAFDVVVFTNLSQDHLDYHGTIEEYFGVKRRIFEAARSCAVTHVINIDDDYGRLLVMPGENGRLRYGVKDGADVYASDIILSPVGSTFRLHSPVGNTDVSLGMPGFYNIYNALAAAGSALALGVGLPEVKRGLEGLKAVPGRFERIDLGQDFTVIVDYAHTPDSLEKVLSAARELTEGKLISVFGCGGDRDKGKRPMMGRVAAELSDHVVVTSDNPRSEVPAQIIEHIVVGVNEVPGSAYAIEADRRIAIEKAIKMARRGDFVVIAGKGHEKGQEMAGKKTPFDDVEVATEFLREL